MAELPSGTVTFLFTDIEGSTRLLKLLREGYGRVVGEHREVLRAAFAVHRGVEVDSQGDSFFVVFRRAKDAIDAAAAGQRALRSHAWPEAVEVRVRMGIHTGQAEASEGRYHGLAVHRAARIMAAAHGGQVLVSQTTRELLEDEEEEAGGIVLRDLGVQRLKDLDRPVRLHQLEIPGLPDEFPPLGTVQPEPPVGQAAEVKGGRGQSWRLVAPAVLIVAGAVVVAVVLMHGGSGSAQASAVAADSVGVFQSGGGKLVARVPVRARPNSVAAGLGSIWVTNTDGDSVSRIDATTNVAVQTIPVGNGPSGIAVGAGFVWVANSLAGTVTKIDPRTNGGSGGVVDTIAVGNEPSSVAFGLGSVWVANTFDRTVTPIDARTDAPRRAIPAGTGADGIAAGAGALWVTSETAGTVTRIDPRTGTLQPINVGSGPTAVTVGAGSVWVANTQGGTVSRINPASNEATAAIPAGDGPSGISVAGDVVWVSNELAGTLARIDPAQGKVVKTIETGNRPAGIALTANRLFVAVRGSGLGHRGGTLISSASASSFSAEADAIDPGRSYGDWRLLSLTNDGLIGYKRVGGGEGARLAPDLATRIPTPTNGGTTYTFQLRRGVRYSTGAPVRPADFRRAIERSLTLVPGVPGQYFAGIVGAARCVRQPRRCDLSRGIVADPAANTVTFHLTAPDPDFLYKLALPSADAVPADTPAKARLPLPATGPYMVASYDERRGVRLIRNPRFHVWSEAVRPSGYPDEIEFKIVPSAAAGVRSVERQSADVVDVGQFSGLPPALRSALRRGAYASQLHSNPGFNTGYISLNTRVPPFNDLRVRRALNYATDRNWVIAFSGGGDLNHLTCQVLPPNFDGYRPYCPYTSHPNASGRYTGPDLAKARRLVAASGTKGQAVTVWINKCCVKLGPAYEVSLLRKLGYNARLKVVDTFPVYFAAIKDSRRKVQAAGNNWALDYPSAAGFFGPLLTCASFQPGSANNFNLAEFCNKRIDAEIARARAQQASDPQAASVLWSKIDRDITDQAPWVTLKNTRSLDFVSRRVGNYQYNPQWGALLDQLWVR